MISDLKIIDDETASGFGEMFDLEKVLDAAEAFLRGFVAEACMTCAGVRPIIRLYDVGPLPLNDSTYRAFRLFYRVLAARHDVIVANVSVMAGPYRVSMNLQGGDDLLLTEGSREPLLVDGSHWSSLDPTPNLHVVPSNDTSPMFEYGSGDAIAALVRRHAPSGTEAALLLPGLRFPHAAFGAGKKALRIAMLRVQEENIDPVP